MAESLELFGRLQRMLTAHIRDDGIPTIKDILIREDEAICGVTPKGLMPLSCASSIKDGVSDEDFQPWRREDLVTIFDLIDSDWVDKISRGAIDCPIAIESGRFRANVFSYNGEFSLDDRLGSSGKLGMCVRVFPQRIPTLKDLNLPSSAAELANSRSGLLLLSGGTGAGKSTTAAALLNLVNNSRSGHIISIESPIEIVCESANCVVSQREVGSNVESMARGVYDAMREFPVAIQIGEIRDGDAADAAMYAGESGHLVLGTVHANSAVGCLAKMLGFFPGSDSRAESLAQNLLGVISQTLIPNAEEDGWTPIFETITMDAPAREWVSQCDWRSLQEQLRRGDNNLMVSLNHSLVRAVKAGKISRNSAHYYSYDRAHLADLMKRT